MSEWSRVKLAEVAEIRFSNVDKKTILGEVPVRLCNYMDVYGNGGYITNDLPFMEASVSPVEIDRFRVERGDVMLTKDSETPDDIGIPAVVVDDIPNLVCGYHLALIKPRREQIDSVYLAKQLGSKPTARYFSRLANGSTRYGLSSSSIGCTSIPLAPLSQQRRIAEILSALDEAIEQTEALIAKYQQIKAGLMHDLFTRGLTPDGLRPTRAQAPHLYKESPLGWIPKDWEVVRIGEAFEIQLGKMLNKFAKMGKLSASYLGNRAVQWDFVDISAIEVMDFNAYERQKFSLLPDDLLVCEGGDVGRTAMWRGEMDGCYYQKAIHRLRPKSADALPAFMLRFMRFARDNGSFREFTSQSSIAHLTQEKLGSIGMFLPSLDEQKRIADRLDSLDGVIQTEQSKLAQFCHQKHGLMHDLLTGRVRVKVAEAEVKL